MYTRPMAEALCLAAWLRVLQHEKLGIGMQSAAVLQ